jgi:hypothetical protein
VVGYLCRFPVPLIATWVIIAGGPVVRVRHGSPWVEMPLYGRHLVVLRNGYPQKRPRSTQHLANLQEKHPSVVA